MNESQALRTRLAEAAEAIWVVDTHEHIPGEAAALAHNKSFFDFFEHYVSCDLVSAGMPARDLERMRNAASAMTLEERWALMAPYWPYVRHTGYGRAMRGYMRDLFGIDDIDRHSYIELCARIRAAQRPGWHREVLKDKARIAAALVTRWPGESVEVDRALYRAVPILDHYATPACPADLEALERESGATISSLDGLLEALEKRLDAHLARSIAGVKVFLAYQRTLHFEHVERSDAGRAFVAVAAAEEPLPFSMLKPLQDYVMWRLFELAGRHNLPVQIHTGLQEGNGNLLEQARPTLLTNVFMACPKVRFDVFHAGFPWTNHVGVLAKAFPNVYADLCWIPAVSPRAARAVLRDWLDMTPVNKIFAVGGDSNYVEGAYGHCQTARRITAEALASLVEDGGATEDEAVWIAQRLLRDNAADCFNLTDLD